MARTMELDSGEALGRIAKGLLAGTAGTAAMTVAQTRILPRIPSGSSSRTPRYPRTHKDEPATETAARRILEGLAARQLSDRQKKVAGDLLHFATGAVWAGPFALFSRRRATVVDGLAFGTLVWLLNDNLLSPALRFTDWGWRYPVGANLKGLFAHLVYGVGSALALRTLRALRV